MNQDTESGGAAPSVPTNQTMPNQQGGTDPASDYIATADRFVTADAASARTVLGPAQPPAGNPQVLVQQARRGQRTYLTSTRVP